MILEKTRISLCHTFSFTNTDNNSKSDDDDDDDDDTSNSNNSNSKISDSNSSQCASFWNLCSLRYVNLRILKRIGLFLLMTFKI